MTDFEKTYEVELREHKTYKIKFNYIKPTMAFSFMEIYHRTEVKPNIETMETLSSLYDFVLENTQIRVNDKWFPVKEKGRDIYYPERLAQEYDSIYTIFDKFLEVVITPFFPEDTGNREENTSAE